MISVGDSVTGRFDIQRIEDLTRREFMFSALGATLLIACGDADEDAEPGATPGCDLVLSCHA